MAGLDPDTVRIRNPVRTFVEVGVGNEVFAASSIRIEAIGELLKAVIGKGIPLCEPQVREAGIHSKQQAFLFPQCDVASPESGQTSALSGPR